MIHEKYKQHIESVAQMSNLMLLVLLLYNIVALNVCDKSRHVIFFVVEMASLSSLYLDVIWLCFLSILEAGAIQIIKRRE